MKAYCFRRQLWAVMFAFLSAHALASRTDTVHVDVASHGADISPTMYGVFFEEINHAGDGGLYGELVQNRSFEEDVLPPGYTVNKRQVVSPKGKNHLTGESYTKSHPWHGGGILAWSLSNPETAKMVVTTEKPKFDTAPHNLKVTLNGSAPVQLINSGYWGMGIRKGEKYKLRTIVRSMHPLTLTARLLDRKGKTIAEERVKVSGGEWDDQTITLAARATCDSSSLSLEIPATEGNGVTNVWFDYVSLFPEHTFRNRTNGLRRDVAETIAALKPTFFRWPGGCVVEGITLDNRFDWKKTLGDPAARPGEYSLWGYHCSYGMGYKEMLDYCEDIGANMMFVCNVGMDCELRLAQVCPADSVKFFLKDCLDALDYALGDASTEYGARRIADGHPAPYPLAYVEVGNENWGPIYQERFALFRDAIKERYPQLSIIYNVMRKRESGDTPKTDLIDPHWYKDPAFFFSSTRLFDDWERGKHNVYVGEYACNGNVGAGNMYAALSEAAFIGGMERNGDLVTMASYAPLLENVNNRRWRTNLIWIDSDQVMGRSSYWVQRMAAENRPDYNLLTDFVPQKATKTVGDADFNASDEHASSGKEELKGFVWVNGGCPLQFIDAGYDQTAGEVVLKVVNATSLPWTKFFNLSHATQVERKGKVITLAAKRGEDENSMAQPMKISPKVTAYGQFGQQFSYTFKPFSYTILRVKAAFLPD